MADPADTTQADRVLALDTLRKILRDPKASPAAKIRAARLLHEFAAQEERARFNAEQMDALGLKPWPIA